MSLSYIELKRFFKMFLVDSSFMEFVHGYFFHGVLFIYFCRLRLIYNPLSTFISFIELRLLDGGSECYTRSIGRGVVLLGTLLGVQNYKKLKF